MDVRSTTGSFDSCMTWHDHINAVASKASERLGLLGGIRKYLSVDTCKHLHDTLVQPLYEYCDIIWSNSDKTCLDRLLRLRIEEAIQDNIQKKDQRRTLRTTV